MKGHAPMAGSTRPAPSTESGLFAKDLGTEIVVIDTVADTAHSLSGDAAEAWRTGMSRRELLRRTGTVALAGTVITIAMPEVIAAASATIPPVMSVDQSTQTGNYGADFTIT